MTAHSHLLTQLEGEVHEPTFFDALHRLLDDDPRGVLHVLDHPAASKLSPPPALTARILAHIALREVEGTWKAYRGYLNACRAAGGFGVDPPLDALRLFFEETNEHAKAAEVREIAAMECTELLGRVWGDDPMELKAASVTLDERLEAAPVADKAEVARTCALKACVLTKLGQKAEALKFWKKADEAAPDVAEFWRQNSLLA